MRAVEGLADQDEPGVADQVQQRVDRGSAILDRRRLRADDRDVGRALLVGRGRSGGRRATEQVPDLLVGCGPTTCRREGHGAVQAVEFARRRAAAGSCYLGGRLRA
jgi:hypothetical protein